MDLTVSRTVYELKDRGGRGLNGQTGDFLDLIQTNDSGNVVLARPVQEGAPQAIGTTYSLTLTIATEGDSLSLQIEGRNAGDPRLVKFAGTDVNFVPRDVPKPYTLVVRGRPAEDGIDCWDIIAPGPSSASRAQTLDALKPGLASPVLFVTPDGLGSFAEAMGVLMNRLALVRPTKSRPYVSVKVSNRRWWVVTYVVGGGRQDYAVHELVDDGLLQSPQINSCVRYNGCVAMIDGVQEDFSVFTGEVVAGGQMDSLEPPVWEPVFNGRPVGGSGVTADYIGPRHGHLIDPTIAIISNGGGANLALPANAPIGTVVRGSSFVVDQSFKAMLKDNVTQIGVYNVAHIFVPGGVQITGSLTTTAEFAMESFYGGMMSGRGDRLKGAGIDAIAADQASGEYGAGGAVNANLGELEAYQLYTLGREGHFMRMRFPGGGPMSINGSAYTWANNSPNRDSFLQARNDYAKVYVHGVNKVAPWTIPVATKFDFNVIYEACRGFLA